MRLGEGAVGEPLQLRFDETRLARDRALRRRAHLQRVIAHAQGDQPRTREQHHCGDYRCRQEAREALELARGHGDGVGACR
jgi:hypothetical protein